MKFEKKRKLSTTRNYFYFLRSPRIFENIHKIVVRIDYNTQAVVELLPLFVGDHFALGRVGYARMRVLELDLDLPRVHQLERLEEFGKHLVGLQLARSHFRMLASPVVLEHIVDAHVAALLRVEFEHERTKMRVSFGVHFAEIGSQHVVDWHLTHTLEVDRLPHDSHVLRVNLNVELVKDLVQIDVADCQAAAARLCRSVRVVVVRVF